METIIQNPSTAGQLTTLARQDRFPLELGGIWASLDEAKDYAGNSIASYNGQLITVVYGDDAGTYRIENAGKGNTIVSGETFVGDRSTVTILHKLSAAGDINDLPVASPEELSAVITGVLGASPHLPSYNDPALQGEEE